MEVQQMLVNGFKKAVLVVAIMVLTVSAAWGAPKDSALVPGGAQKGDTSLEREIEGGIKITVQEIYKQGSDVWIKYSVLSEEDTFIKVEVNGDNGTLFDDQGNQFRSYNDWIRIGNQKTKEREVIGGVPTIILVGYEPGEKYAMPTKFPRVAINLNEKKLIFRDVPGKQ
jgi:hypothetical protein